MDSILILMMFIPSTLLFVLVLLLSVFIIISSPSWLGAWVGLEVNLISFIPLILSRGVLTRIESCIKYFLVQAFSSLLLLLSLLIIISDGYRGEWFIYLPHRWLLGAALLIKLGAAPFHFWFPAVSSGIGWYQNFILITWQKIGPLVLLSYVWGAGPTSMVLVGLSTVVGRVGGLNQRSLRKLMAFSSINHLGWLLVASYFGVKFILIYFLIYMVTNAGLVLGLSAGGIFYLSQVYYYRGSHVKSIVVLVNWLSFGGLPPFIGFFAKWMVISLIVDRSMVPLCLFMVIISLVSLFYYTRICYTVLSQSGSVPLMRSFAEPRYWWVNFLVFRLVLGLVLAPIFVIWL